MARKGRPSHAIKAQAKAVVAGAGRVFNSADVSDSAIDELRYRAIRDSADMIEPHLGTAALVSSHPAMQRSVAERLTHAPDGLFLEFGFHIGLSARVFSEALQGRTDRPTLYSFDAFQGLRNSWSQVDHSVGAFDLGGRPPEAPQGVELVVGWLEDTLEGFLSNHDGHVSFCHFDLDVYEPTRFGLETIKGRLRPGSLILFDELHGYPGWRSFEWRALNESYGPDEYRFVAFGPEQALIEWIGVD